jgi:heme exporter protein B
MAAPLRAHGALHLFHVLVRRDLLLAVRRRGELANPVLFFVLVVSLFPLGVGPEQSLLRTLAPGVIWVAALLATLLSLERMFRSDFEDGALEQMLLGPRPATLVVLGKVLAHWLVTGLPLLVVAPVLGVLLALPAAAMGTLLLTLLLGTPVLSLVGAIGVALTVGLRRGGALLSLVVLPLYVPVLIFGATAVDAAAAGLPVTGHLYVLAALLVLAFTLAPPAAAAALRISVN